MAYNTKGVIKDKDGNPISQYFNPVTDEYEAVEGSNGANKVVVYNGDGTASDVSLLPIIEKLGQLTGSVVDEETRKSNETVRESNEDIRVLDEGVRVSSESQRVLDETERASNEITRVDNESVRVTNEDDRIISEVDRKASEVIRVDNEVLRVALYELLQQKLANGDFKGDKGDIGNGLEYTWRGTELGVRVEGQLEYVFVDLKGETGSIESLNSNHIITALGYTPTNDLDFQEHIQDITSVYGKHGIRYFEEKLEVYNGIEWIEIKTGGGSSVRLGNILDLSIEAQVGNKIKINWNDPMDVILEGITLATWGGTQLRRKLSTYPMDEKDGELVVDNKVRGQYSTGYLDEGLVNGQKYYYTLFPYTTDNVFTIDIANRIDAIAFEKYEQAPPTKPIVSSLGSLKATVSSDIGSVVSLDQISWFPSPHEFIGLLDGQTYVPYAKFEEKVDYFESPIVTGDSFIAINKLPQDPPPSPDISNLSFDKVTVTGISGTEVKLDDGEWLNSPQTYTGLIAETEYMAYARMKETETMFASDSSIAKEFITPSESQLYGVKIDTNNSNPETAVTYTDMAIGFTPMFCNNGTWQMGSWADKFPFNEIKPCLLKNGVVNYYLNPNDYTQKASGGASDITSGTDGDVMIEFPKIYWKFERIGTDLHIRYSNTKVDEDYKCLAHTVGLVEKDKIYLSAYRGFSTGGKLRSLSGKLPTATQTIGQFRTLAQANGAGYQQMAYYPLLMLQVLALVAGKNRDTQTQLGRGYVDGNTSATNTGQTNTNGMYYGETTGKKQNKFCGIEDFWGNQECWIDGIFSNTSWNMLISDQTVFNDTGAGYVNHGQGATANFGGYIDDVQGGTETGFIIKGKAGSATTHYSDYGYLYGGSLASLPGDWNAGGNAGAFGLAVSRAASASNAVLGARLCNLG